MNRPPRVAFIGAGGSGKSTVLNIMKRDGFAILPSVSRGYFALQGIPDEPSYLALPEAEKKAFQVGMMDYYMKTYNEFMQAHPDDPTLTDRTCFDHLTYCMYSIMDFTIDEIETLFAKALSFAQEAYTHIVFFPYPQPWMSDGHGEDGFRAAMAPKQLCTDALMFRFLNRARHHSVFAKDVCVLEVKPSFDSAEETYKKILAASGQSPWGYKGGYYAVR